MIDEAWVRNTFRWFHQHPETGWEERETTAMIRRQLGDIDGVELLPWPFETGALARIVGKADGPAILLRSDIDALPITEQSGLPYASPVAGRMHACGHDWHMTNLLACARLLAARRSSLAGTVYLVFQPAEESGAGAAKVVATGFLETYGIREVYGCHVQPMIPAGTIALCDGAISAAVGKFSVTVQGKGCHGAKPHTGLDPLPASCRLILSLQEIVSRMVDANDQAVFTVGHVESDGGWNIVPSHVSFTGTCRAFSPRVERVMEEAFTRKAKALEAEGYVVDIVFHWGTPATDNDPALTDRVRAVAKGLGYPLLELTEKEMSGEDFSYYQEKIPGVFWHVGVGGSYPLHSPRFTADGSAIPASADFLAHVAEDALERLAGHV